MLLSPCSLLNIHYQPGKHYVSLPLTAFSCPVVSLLSFLAPLLTQLSMRFLNWYFSEAFLKSEQQSLPTLNIIYSLFCTLLQQRRGTWLATLTERETSNPIRSYWRWVEGLSEVITIDSSYPWTPQSFMHAATGSSWLDPCSITV